MALLQNEDFAIWFLRTSYLATGKDGLGERLINVNNSILNTPGFRAAGWSTEPLHRTHSPPIPTTGASEYLQNGPGLQRETSFGDDEDEGGMVTGRTSNDTIGPGPNARRRRRKEQMDDDDSSDLTDESDDDGDGAQRAAQQIRFAKMPARSRADSSPIRNSNATDGLNVTITSPSKPTTGRSRTGSLGAVEAVKARARRDTTTSSELSSENEVDPAYFQRRQINSKSSRSNTLNSIAQEEEPVEHHGLQDDSDGDSVGSALSSELGETVDSVSLLNAVDDNTLPTSSPIMPGVASLNNHAGRSESPRRNRTLPPLQTLPPARPISFVEPTSLLSKALNAQKKTPKNPIQGFATLSGKGNPNPLWIKIYAPFSSDPENPFEMPIARVSRDGFPVIVAEAIGLSLWRYQEEELKPSLEPAQLNVNKWVLRMVEDGEVEFDFPALVRTRPITDFTINNNRGGRGRSRDKPFDEFALVEAKPHEFDANNRDTPQFIPSMEEEEVVSSPVESKSNTHPVANRINSSKSNVLLAGQPFATALSNTGVTPADQPAQAAPRANPRAGVTKTIRVRHFDIDVSSRTMTLELSTDSYIAEILDHVCKRWNFDKGFYVLKVMGTNTVAPLDRTVEALGTRSDLELARKRFGAGPMSTTGSPGSASPNAPLLLDIQGPRKGKKGQMPLQALAQKQDLMASASNFKKHYVTRKQLTSFTQGSQRVLIFDGDFLHIMPTDTGKVAIDANAKSTSLAFADMVRCKVSSKHSKLVRVVVQRGSEQKRYDFEARTAGEAQEIVDDISKEMKIARR